MKKVKAFILIAVLAAAAVLAAGSFDLSEKRDYRDFIESVEAGDVEKARISEESIRYTLKGEKGWYSTVNPSSPALTESLLLSGVDVGFESDSLGSALDDAFNILFLAIVAFGLYKLASWYFSTFRIVRHTGVSFSDIAGMDNLKEEMSYAVSVLRNRGEGNVRSIRGIILEGPPGNGKTLFAKALAQECGVNFIATRGADFQGALMGL
ncbi:MAG: AAA family ATPase, partial [Candidatus Ornithospirochaeta sp.]|nr:AAA family ATPase [Candidatus Ornithospirochaeta sp.]